MTEKILIAIVAVFAAMLVFRVAQVTIIRRHRPRLDDWAAADTAISDEQYVTAITDDKFDFGQLYRPDDRPVRPGALRPAAARTARLEVEPDSYITGRAVRIIRRAEEERTQWHWDELTGTWNPPGDMVKDLEWDDWLRTLLTESEVAA
jgi:hypothetical protein